MPRQLIVLAAAFAVHATAVVAVGHRAAPPPPPRAIERVQLAVPRCQVVTPITEPRAAPAGEITDAELDAGIRTIDATHRVATRALLERVLENPMRIARGARIVPAVYDGKPSGFKLYAVRPNSAYARLGFQNGDTLRAINGYDLTSADKALETYTRLREASDLDFALSRHGVPLVLHLAIL